MNSYNKETSTNRVINKNKKEQNQGKSKEMKHLYKYHRHPNANHEWKDRVYNSRSRNYCRHTRKSNSDRKARGKSPHKPVRVLSLRP